MGKIKYKLNRIKLNIKHFYLNTFSKRYREERKEMERLSQEELKYIYENNIET